MPNAHLEKLFVLSLATWHVFKALGIEIEDAYPLSAVKLTSAAGLQSLSCSAQDLSALALGYCVKGSVLLKALGVSVSACSAIKRLQGVEVSDYSWESGQGLLEYGNAQTLSVDLVLAADGRNSPLRSRVGIPWVDLQHPTVVVQVPIYSQGRANQAELRWLAEGGTVALIPASQGFCKMVGPTVSL